MKSFKTFNENNQSIFIQLFVESVQNADIIKILNDNYKDSWQQKTKNKFIIQTKLKREITKQEFELLLMQNNIPFTNDKVSGSSFMATVIDKIKILYKPLANKNANAKGKELADAGERATIVSLTNDINDEKDTKEKIFIEDSVSFERWKNTFEKTKIAVNSVLMNDISLYDIIHDGTDTSPFSKVITKFVSGKAKDSWNPADIFIISKSRRKDITKELNDIVDAGLKRDVEVSSFNSAIYKFYKEGLLYPISLKQVIAKNASISFNNIPNAKTSVKYDDISIKKFNLDMSMNTKEIGLFVFQNLVTEKDINMQVRGFPHGYTTAQTEITNDGSVTGGRLGKVSTKVIDAIMAEYNSYRIKSIGYFGRKPKYFSNIEKTQIADIVKWYNKCKKYSKVVEVVPISNPRKYFTDLVEVAKVDLETAEILAIKIQGLKQMEFFVSNVKNIKTIMNNMINGAKKISKDNGFFIKIY